MLSRFHAVIPAGGSGTRLWPLSRSGRPKFLLDVLGGGRTLIQETWDRIEALTPAENRWVVTGEAHADGVAEQLPGLPQENIIAEPAPRDSAAAIGLAAMLIRRRDPEAIIGSFSADHSITNPREFRRVVTEAVHAAETGDIVTIGITPTFPSTAYGYIKTGDRLGLPKAPNAMRAKKFVEKPAANTARRYAYSGKYRWNAGMFIARADALLAQYRAFAPELHAGLSAVADAWGTEDHEAVLADVWPGLESIAIDYVVAEPAAAQGQVIVVPGDFGWDDVGDFASVAQLRQPIPGEQTSVYAVGDDVRLVDVDSSGLVYSTSDRAIALVGVEDIVVVDTDDALLVTRRSSAQRVKEAVKRAKELGFDDVL